VLKDYPDLKSRVLGTAPGPHASPLYAPFLEDFHQGQNQAEPGNLAECGFDAAYLLAYASTKAAIDTAWPQGTDLVKAIKQLTCADAGKTRLEAGRGFSDDAVTLLQNPSGCFDFQGASGSVDYRDFPDSQLTPKSQELSPESSDMALWCLRDTETAADVTVNLPNNYYSQSNTAITPELSLSDSDWCAKAIAR
jgi:hypothetical protein